MFQYIKKGLSTAKVHGGRFPKVETYNYTFWTKTVQKPYPLPLTSFTTIPGFSHLIVFNDRDNNCYTILVQSCQFIYRPWGEKNKITPSIPPSEKNQLCPFTTNSNMKIIENV